MRKTCQRVLVGNASFISLNDFDSVFSGNDINNIQYFLMPAMRHDQDYLVIVSSLSTLWALKIEWNTMQEIMIEILSSLFSVLR